MPCVHRRDAQGEGAYVRGQFKVVELGMGSSRFEVRVSALAGFGARVFAVALIIRLNCAGSRPILERRARVHAAVRRS